MALSACGNQGMALNPEPVRFVVDFAASAQTAETGFADYPAGEEGFYELDAGWESVPDLADARGIYLNGNNHSDDLFMFLRVPVTGLLPGGRYRVGFTVEMATNAGQGCAGIGGAPGESVYVKAGMTATKPQAVDSGDGFLQMNIDKGVQSNPGADAVVLGNIAGTQTRCSDGNPYERKQLQATEAMEFRADDEGAGWLIVGTDSGFEGVTRVYYMRLLVDFQPPES